MVIEIVIFFKFSDRHHDGGFDWGGEVEFQELWWRCWEARQRSQPVKVRLKICGAYRVAQTRDG